MSFIPASDSIVTVEDYGPLIVQPPGQVVCALCGRTVPRGCYVHLCDGALDRRVTEPFQFGPAMGKVCEHCGRLWHIARPHYCPGRVGL